MKYFKYLTFLSLFVGAIFFFGFIPENNSQTQIENKQDTKVLICNSSSAYAYHSYYCSGLKRCKSNVLEVSVSYAKSKNRSACKICYK